jgi:hypothetical protein
VISWKDTSRGFKRGTFKDRYGADCSIQKSSLAFEDCVWLGANEITAPAGAEPINTRMHLTREMAGVVAAQLMAFYVTGELIELSPREVDDDQG